MTTQFDSIGHAVSLAVDALGVSQERTKKLFETLPKGMASNQGSLSCRTKNYQGEDVGIDISRFRDGYSAFVYFLDTGSGRRL